MSPDLNLLGALLMEDQNIIEEAGNPEKEDIRNKNSYLGILNSLSHEATRKIFKTALSELQSEDLLSVLLLLDAKNLPLAFEDNPIAYGVIKESGHSVSSAIQQLRHKSKYYFKNIFSTLKPATLHAFFETAYEHGMGDRLQSAFYGSESLAPQSAKSSYAGWIKHKNESRIQYVEMSRPIVEHGETDEGTPHKIHKDRGEDGERRAAIERRAYIVSLLQKDSANKAIKIYCNNVQAAGANRYPYEIIDIKNDDWNAQIYVCNYKAHATWILKDRLEIDPKNTTVLLSEFKDNPKAFRLWHRFDDQYGSEILKYLMTDLQNLEPQIKHSISWKDKKTEIENSLIFYFLNTGHTPSTCDHSRIEHGALKNLGASWKRVRDALASQSVEGLEECHTIRALFNKLTAELPELIKLQKQHLSTHKIEIFLAKSKMDAAMDSLDKV